MEASLRRDLIVAAARRWIDTPYVHGQSAWMAGCDCLGLVRGVWRDLYGSEPELPPVYTADWAEIGGREDLLSAARRNLAEIPLAEAAAGSVLLFRWRPGLPAKHCGILSAPGRMIHAYDRRRVHEIALPAGWRRRIAAAFDFPGAN
ncbi:NlpC/P60 family protein [Mesorhizobium australicum]|nr:NlpC/P60 family protein [Mesorhizobium australicum]